MQCTPGDEKVQVGLLLRCGGKVAHTWRILCSSSLGSKVIVSNKETGHSQKRTT